MQIICTSLHTNNRSSTPSLSFLHARCPSSCRSTNSVKALKAKNNDSRTWEIPVCVDCQLSKLLFVWLTTNTGSSICYQYYTRDERVTRRSSQRCLQRARLGFRGGHWAFHWRQLISSTTGLNRPLTALCQSLGYRRVVSRQVGQLMEDCSLANYCVDQVGITWQAHGQVHNYTITSPSHRQVHNYTITSPSHRQVHTTTQLPHNHTDRYTQRHNYLPITRTGTHNYTITSPSHGQVHTTTQLPHRYMDRYTTTHLPHNHMDRYTTTATQLPHHHTDRYTTRQLPDNHKDRNLKQNLSG